MMQKRLLNGTLSLLVLATSLSAQGNCVGNACFVKIKKTKSNKMHCVGNACFVNLDNVKPSSENYTDVDEVDNSFEVVIDGELTIVFPSYVMTEAEKRVYIQEQRAIALNKKANEEANKELKIVTQPVEKIEDKILNKNLPTSEYFCDNDKKPIQIKNSDLYECV